MLEARRPARALIVVLLLSLIPAAAAEASHNVQRLEQTRREIRATRARLANAMASETDVRAQLNAVTARLNTHQAALNAARARLARIDLKVRAQRRRLAGLAAEQAIRQQAIGERARALYMMGPADAFQALTTATSIEEFVGRAGAIEMVNDADLLTVERLESAKYESRRIRAELSEQRAAAVEIKDEIAGQVSLIAEIAAVKREAHARLAGKVTDFRGELAALEREQARIIALIRARSSTSRGPISRSGFIWPVRGNITSPYGPRWGGFHTGMDIDCRTGDGIKASKAGRVIESGWGGGYGNMIVIDHGNGVATLYAHMSRLYKSRGAQVPRGQIIGACGTTGNSTGDHLHFEVRINGNHTNPRPYLP
ncbi:MAG TPA: peptidoglycan DD-metalloendopeptidase family protein [Actinomycetota bacterium]